MSGEETTIRSLASESRVNSKWFKTGMLPNGELYRDQHSGDNRTFGRTCRSCSMTMGIRVYSMKATICAKARRWRRDPSVFKTGDERGMILIDYLP